MSKDYNYSYKINVEWDDNSAQNIYHLVTFQERDNGERVIAREISGDREWAGRIAEHYGIEVPGALVSVKEPKSLIKSIDLSEPRASKSGRKTKYAWMHSLEVGHSWLLNKSQHSGAVQHAWRYGKRSGKKFSFKKDGKAYVSVTRVK